MVASSKNREHSLQEWKRRWTEVSIEVLVIGQAYAKQEELGLRNRSEGWILAKAWCEGRLGVVAHSGHTLKQRYCHEVESAEVKERRLEGPC